MTSINIPLTELGLDTPFIDQSRRMGLITLSDIINSRLETLSKKRDFTYVWYADLLKLLKEQGLLDEFQQRQL